MARRRDANSERPGLSVAWVMRCPVLAGRAAAIGALFGALAGCGTTPTAATTPEPTTKVPAEPS